MWFVFFGLVWFLFGFGLAFSLVLVWFLVWFWFGFQFGFGFWFLVGFGNVGFSIIVLERSGLECSGGGEADGNLGTNPKVASAGLFGD